MSGMRWDDHLTGPFVEIRAKASNLEYDMEDGAKVVLDEAVSLVPKESGHLAETGAVKRNRGGTNTVAIVFSGPYARWIHEHMGFKHPRGGQAKFLEAAMLLKGKDAINQAGKHFWRRL